MTIIISFKHPYFKLMNGVFSTVRGKSWINRIHCDEIVMIHDNYRKLEYRAQVLSVDLVRIKDMCLSFVKLDGSHPNRLILCRGDFIDLLNSFRRFNKIESEEEELCVIWLVKGV